MGRDPIAGRQVAVQPSKGLPLFEVRGRRPPGVPEESMEEVGVSDAQRGMNASIQSHESNEANRIFGRCIRPCGFPLDLLEVGRDERDFAGRTEIQEGRPGQQRRIQPEGMVRDQVIDAGGT
jgi:hypothetical protein